MKKIFPLFVSIGIFAALPLRADYADELKQTQKDLRSWHVHAGLADLRRRIGSGEAFVADPVTGEVLPDGQYGELVFTCLGKEALPLIRYRTHDITCLNHYQCACGRTTVRMAKPRGRSDDMLIIRGVNVFPSEVEYVITSLGFQPNYEIIVDKKNEQDIMTLKLELTDELFSDTIRDLKQIEYKLIEKLKGDLGVAVKVQLVEPNSLPRYDGKANRVTDLRKNYD